MWNTKTRQLVAEEKLIVIGVVQEQHSERARLYKQWKQYEFPIVQDAINELALSAVPIPILIDEHGIVISSRPSPNKIADLVSQPTKPPVQTAATVKLNYREQILANDKQLKKNGGAAACVLGDAYLNAACAGNDKTTSNIQQAIEVYESCLADDANANLLGQLHFRLGVAYRMKFDNSPPTEQSANDFTLAAKHWSKALSVNPNQYIWRRRIQQYGPRLDKPYPFYDWLPQAQKEIKNRGETPIELTVALAGAEQTRPERKFNPVASQETNPDPESKITKDVDAVKVHATAVPQLIAPGKAVRVHMRFDLTTAKWNNEAEDMTVWVEPSEFGKISQSKWTYPNPAAADSTEPRNIEFEFKTNRSTKSSFELDAYALYYICKDETGQCLYRRQNFKIPITIQAK